jgi:hypothetical protein
MAYYKGMGFYEKQLFSKTLWLRSCTGLHFLKLFPIWLTKAAGLP